MKSVFSASGFFRSVLYLRDLAVLLCTRMGSSSPPRSCSNICLLVRLLVLAWGMAFNLLEFPHSGVFIIRQCKCLTTSLSFQCSQLRNLHIEMPSHYKSLSFISPLYPVRVLHFFLNHVCKGWLFYL